MFKMMDKKIFTILCSKMLFILTYENIWVRTRDFGTFLHCQVMKAQWILRCTHTQSTNIDDDSDKYIDF